MRLVARRYLQDRSLDLGKALLLEPRPERPRDRGPRLQERPAVGVAPRRPPGRGLVLTRHRQRVRMESTSTSPHPGSGVGHNQLIRSRFMVGMALVTGNAAKLIPSCRK